MEQSVLEYYSPNRKDFVQPYCFDPFGIVRRTYSPYASSESNGSYKNQVIQAQQEFYLSASLVAHTQYPYGETEFESSPLMKGVEFSAPGYTWNMAQNNTVKSEYLFNKQSSDGYIRIWYISQDKNSCYSNDSYQDNQLTVTVLRDENSGTGTSGSTTKFFSDFT